MDNDMHDLTYDHLHHLCDCPPMLRNGDEAREFLDNPNRQIGDEARYYGVRHVVVKGGEGQGLRLAARERGR